MNYEEPSRIRAWEAFQRRSKEPHRRREEPQETIASDSKKITLVPHHVLRFWNRIRKLENGCWEWTGSKWDNGYGRLMVGKKRVKAHRVSFLIHNGFLTDGKIICHTCDNPSCCNPQHLFEGTCLDNTRDAIAKGRMNSVGERNPRAKLTLEQVQQIRKMKNTTTAFALSKQFNVSKSSICNILRGDNWK